MPSSSRHPGLDPGSRFHRCRAGPRIKSGVTIQPITDSNRRPEMTLRRAAIVAPIRTPVAKFGGSLSSMGAGQLSAVILPALHARTALNPERVEEGVCPQGYGNERRSVVYGRGGSII